MKKSKIIIGLVLLFAMVCNVALFAATEPLYLGSKTPYPEPGKVSYTAAPAGYAPSFIYIAGRHGSRNLSGWKYDKTWNELLIEAEKAGAITEKGKVLKEEVAKITAHEQGKYALLTELGKKELFNIGVRAGQNYKELFATNKPIFADATVIDRAQESRDGFLAGLKSTGYKGEITSIFYKQDRDPYLRPYDIAQKYIAYDSKGKWTKEADKFAEEKLGSMSERILTQFFSKEFYDKLAAGQFKLVDYKKKTVIKDAPSAVQALYELYIILPSLSEDGFSGVDLTKYFTKEELKANEKIQISEEYCSQGPGLASDGTLSTDIMAPLVKRMINEVDLSLTKNAPYIGVFSFAHAETQIPLTCFLEVGTTNVKYNTIAEAVEKWNTADIGPMGGNVQWIVYTAKGKDPLVKMMLNEKEVAFASALKPVSGPYYKWADVKAYYGKKVEKLGVKLDSSIYDNIALLINQF